MVGLTHRVSRMVCDQAHTTRKARLDSSSEVNGALLKDITHKHTNAHAHSPPVSSGELCDEVNQRPTHHSLLPRPLRQRPPLTWPEQPANPTACSTPQLCAFQKGNKNSWTDMGISGRHFGQRLATRWLSGETHGGPKHFPKKHRTHAWRQDNRTQSLTITRGRPTAVVFQHRRGSVCPREDGGAVVVTANTAVIRTPSLLPHTHSRPSATKNATTLCSDFALRVLKRRRC